MDVEPKTKLTGVEVVLTKLHAGAKFRQFLVWRFRRSAWCRLIRCEHALSSRLDVEVDRDGKTHHMAFHQGHPGVYSDVDPEHPSPDSPFKKTRKNRPTELRSSAKSVRRPRVPHPLLGRIRRFFNDTAEFSYDQLIDRVRQTSFLVPAENHRHRREHSRNRRRVH